MAIDTMESTETTTEVVIEEELDPNDPNKFRHLFTKEDLDRNLFDGVAIQAICGFVKRGLANPASTLPFCEKCKFIYEFSDWKPHGPEDGETPL
jgi:hypothetical protein